MQKLLASTMMDLRLICRNGDLCILHDAWGSLQFPTDWSSGSWATDPVITDKRPLVSRPT